GDNGIGKTTLLKILAGLMRPTEGKIIGLPTWYDRLYRSRRQRHVYLHQTPYLFDDTVLNNIYYPLRFNRQPKREKQAKAFEAIKRVGLEHLAHAHISVLSGGEKQRVAMARAWVVSPQILFMDEPSASLDQESITKLMSLSQDLLDRGSSLIITSHQQNRLTELCQRQWWIKDHTLIDTPVLHIIQEKPYVKASEH
ncbi:MAG: energy-coupling factor ABC transporter ATP-binding protein, partial [Vibrio sp.]